MVRTTWMLKGRNFSHCRPRRFNALPHAHFAKLHITGTGVVG